MKRRKRKQHRRKPPIVRHRKLVKRDVIARKLKQEERDAREESEKRTYTPKDVIDLVRRLYPRWPKAWVYAAARARHEVHRKATPTSPEAGRVTFTAVAAKAAGSVPRIVPREAVNHPNHYGGAANPYEAIKVIEAWGLGFNLGSTLKYISRAGKKGSQIEDLEKGRWYLDREIANLKKRQATL